MIAILTVAAVAGFAVVRPAVAASRGSQGWQQIKHVVILMMENHAYDSYFGLYCQHYSKYCPNVGNGIPAGACVPYNPSRPFAGCEKPFELTTPTPHDMGHDWAASHLAYDGGKMDGFYQADGLQTMGHYDGSSVPVYWDIAEEFGLGDDSFSSTLSYSVPNHWYLLAASAPPAFSRSVSQMLNPTQQHQYLAQANATPTVEQELNAHPGVSWAYYDFSLNSYSRAINMAPGPGSAFSLFNPLASKHQSYVGNNPNHFQPRSQFFADVSSGSLPDIAWVMPSLPISDHPPDNIFVGQNFTASIVDAIESSSQWSSTALFITWDDFGGFYDHVVPPAIDQYGDGFRTPLLVVSPWTPAGIVVHTDLRFESLLHFVEWHWNLGCIAPRDCNAHLPLGFFNFQLHRHPVLIPNSSRAQYPYVPPAGAVNVTVPPSLLDSNASGNLTEED